MLSLLKSPDEIFKIDHTIDPDAPGQTYGSKLYKLVQDMGVGHLRWDQFMEFNTNDKFIDVAQGWTDGKATNGLSVLPPRINDKRYIVPLHWTVFDLVSYMTAPEKCTEPWTMLVNPVNLGAPYVQ